MMMFLVDSHSHGQGDQAKYVTQRLSAPFASTGMADRKRDVVQEILDLSIKGCLVFQPVEFPKVMVLLANTGIVKLRVQSLQMILIHSVRFGHVALSTITLPCQSFRVLPQEEQVGYFTNGASSTGGCKLFTTAGMFYTIMKSPVRDRSWPA